MKEKIETWCVANFIEFIELTKYQYRLVKLIKKGDIVYSICCDIYLVHKRYHIIRHTEKEMVQTRGDIKELEIFLESVFNYE